MPESDKLFAGSIPETYDTYLVPLIFEAFASDLASRVAAQRPGSILETAAGSGVVTRALGPLLADDVEYVVSDLNQPMLDRAIARQEPDSRIAWQQADALALPFEDERFDAVFCQFGVMFFPDRARAFREARRVLSPGGGWLFNVWDELAHNDVARLVHQAAVSAFPEDPPRFIERVPHGQGDPVGIEGDLRAAGFDEVAWEVVSARSHAPSAREAAIGVCEGTPLRHEIVKRDPARLPLVVEAAARGIRDALGDGPIDGEMRAFVFSAKER